MATGKKDHLSPRVQLRITNFINAAKRPEDIAKKAKISKDVAQRILDQRAQIGPFGIRDTDQFLKVIPRDLLDDILVPLFSASSYGEWTSIYATPMVPAHAALLRTGRVLFFPVCGETPTDWFLWDPAAETAEGAFLDPDNQPDDNLYCSGHSFLSDGRLLVVGGGGDWPSVINRAWKFDPVAGTNGEWTQTAGDMTYERWYPTAVTLGGGRALVVAGRRQEGMVIHNDKVEVYKEWTDSFSPVTLPEEREFTQTYPGLHLIPWSTGKVFYTSTGFGDSGPDPYAGAIPTGTFYFEFTGTYAGAWVDIADTMDFPNRAKGMSALLLLGPLAGSYITKVLVAAGNNNDTAEIFNLSTLAWELPTTIPGGGRSNANVVLLPDNTAFLCGGAAGSTTLPVYPCALYDPMTNTWAPMDSVEYRRAYHSVALLLPSGQVMITGDENGTIEVFSPPYLFGGARPEIASIPSLVHHGETFEVETPQASEIESVVLVRPMAVTHQTDTEQRVVPMSFTRDGDLLHVTAPDGMDPHPLAPAGYYMLFIVNGDGVPSVGQFLRLH